MFKFPKIVISIQFFSVVAANIGRLMVGRRMVMTYSHVKTIHSLDWLSVQCSNIHEILGFSLCFKINS